MNIQGSTLSHGVMNYGQIISTCLLCQQVVKPQIRHFFLHGVCAQTIIEVFEIDLVEYLILIEARENRFCLFAGYRIDMFLQALCTDFLHHALHWRVNRYRLQYGPGGNIDQDSHPVAAPPLQPPSSGQSRWRSVG